MEEKNCRECENKVTDGVCCGSEENGMVDTTGEKKCFKPDYLCRMRIELKELDEKINKLGGFIESEKFETLDDVQKHYLIIQIDAMRVYEETLAARISYEEKLRNK
jgi:hypothetical protein